VQQKPPDELVRREGHDFLLIVVAVVSPSEFHLAIFNVDDPTFFDPLGTCEGLTFWTMTVATGVVTGPLVITAVAPLQMTTESCSSTHLDRGHDAPLCSG
jgi:hypothetical protein